MSDRDLRLLEREADPEDLAFVRRFADYRKRLGMEMLPDVWRREPWWWLAEIEDVLRYGLYPGSAMKFETDAYGVAAILAVDTTWSIRWGPPEENGRNRFGVDGSNRLDTFRMTVPEFLSEVYAHPLPGD